jgi:hypothetical protein
MAWARENRYIVFTNDLDYGALLFATAAASPSVIQIRAEDIRPASAEHAVLFAFEAAREFGLRGHVGGTESDKGTAANSLSEYHAPKKIFWLVCGLGHEITKLSVKFLLRAVESQRTRSNHYPLSIIHYRLSIISSMSE